MKNILIGNGVNVNFDGKASNASIINRIQNNFSSGKYNNRINLFESAKFINILFKEFPKFIKGEYDSHAYFDTENIALKRIKEKYKWFKNFKTSDIGLEDYFILQRLACNRVAKEPELKKATYDGLWEVFIDSIYNSGKIQDIYKKYPIKFINFLNQCDNIFTVNYDNNIEQAVHKRVYHLHGDFSVKREVYIEDSVRNMLPDKPIEGFVFDEEFQHLYCNAVMDFSGNNKVFTIIQGKNANIASEKYAIGYLNDSKIKADIDSWKNDSNKLVQQLYHVIMLKIKNPEIMFSDNYHFDKLDEIADELSIIGLSPSNDMHLFDKINANNKIEKINYYYFNIGEAQTIEELFKNKVFNKIDVKQFWKNMK